MTLTLKHWMMAARARHQQGMAAGVVAAAVFTGGVLCLAASPSEAGCKYPQATKRDTLARNGGASFSRDFLLTRGHANVLAIGTDRPSFDISLSAAINGKERCNRPVKGDNWIMCNIEVGVGDVDSSRLAQVDLSLKNNDNREVGYVLVCVDLDETKSFLPTAITNPKAMRKSK